MTSKSASRSRRSRQTAGRSRSTQPWLLRRAGTILVVGSIAAIIVGAAAGILVREGVESITPSATPSRPAPSPTVGAISAAPTSPPSKATSTAEAKPEPTNAPSQPVPSAVPAKPTSAPSPPTAAATATPAPSPSPTAAPAKPTPTAIAEGAAPAFAWISAAPQTVKPGQRATVVVQTLPNAQVTLTVLYGTMRETGIEPVRADGSGLAEISWTVSEQAPSGPGRIVVNARSRDEVVSTERGLLVE